MPSFVYGEHSTVWIFKPTTWQADQRTVEAGQSWGIDWKILGELVGCDQCGAEV
jgi:hypothetical protein